MYTVLCSRIPLGIYVTALLSFLASKGLTIVESGQLTAMATLPWTFKLFWGPIIDSFTFEKMGKRDLGFYLLSLVWL